MAKMRLGTRRRFPKRNIFFIIIVLLIVLFIQGFWLLEKRIEPILIEYANLKVIEIATDVIEEAIKEKIANNPNFSQLLIKEKDDTGRLQSITLDAGAANRVQVEVTEHVRDQLKRLSAEKIPVPLGVALDSNILGALGPNINITLVPEGATKVDIVPELKEQGINMVLLTLKLHITTSLQIIIPFTSDEANIDHDVTIAQELIVGEVPIYYFNGSQSVPIAPIAPSQP